jgi:hypothetical protein
LSVKAQRLLEDEDDSELREISKLNRQQLLKQARDARERASEQMRRRKQTIFVKNWR